MNRFSIFRFVALFLFIAGFSAPGMAQQSFDVTAPHAILMDYETGAILYEKSADTPVPPASMAKMMTVFLTFERLKADELSMDTTFTVSVNAWRKGGAATGGSTMFLKPNTEVTVRELLHGVIVQSGNDASIVLAEGIAGSETLFAGMMTDKAKSLGMTNTVFQTATGLPDPDQHVTMRDLAILARETIRRFPELYRLYAEEVYTYNGITQRNRNPLINSNLGVDGLKTGHTEDSGYGLTVSAERKGRRLIAAFNGSEGNDARARIARRLLEHGFLNFNNYDLFAAGEEIGPVNVWLGDKSSVPMVVPEDVTVTLSRNDRENMSATAIYDEPVPAPVQKGQRVGHVRLTFPEHADIEVPLLTANAAEGLGPIAKVGAALEYLIFGASATATAP